MYYCCLWYDLTPKVFRFQKNFNIFIEKSINLEEDTYILPMLITQHLHGGRNVEREEFKKCVYTTKSVIDG